MKQSVKLILWIVIFSAVLAGAVWAYNTLSKDYLPGAPAEQSESVVSSEVDSDPQTEPVKAVDFTVVDMEGNAVTLGEHIGKPILLNFWATWCGPCQSELPAFDAAYAEYGDEVVFMMINLTDGDRETKETVQDFLTENAYGFPVYLDTEYEAMINYGAYSIPLTVAIDADGYVVDGYMGVLDEATLEQMLKNLLP